MSRNINYNTWKGDCEDIRELLEDEEDNIETVQKIKKRKRFDDGTLVKDFHKKVKTIERETEKE